MYIYIEHLHNLLLAAGEPQASRRNSLCKSSQLERSRPHWTSPGSMQHQSPHGRPPPYPRPQYPQQRRPPPQRPPGARQFTAKSNREITAELRERQELSRCAQACLPCARAARCAGVAQLASAVRAVAPLALGRHPERQTGGPSGPGSAGAAPMSCCGGPGWP